MRYNLPSTLPHYTQRRRAETTAAKHQRTNNTTPPAMRATTPTRKTQPQPHDAIVDGVTATATRCQRRQPATPRAQPPRHFARRPPPCTKAHTPDCEPSNTNAQTAPQRKPARFVPQNPHTTARPFWNCLHDSAALAPPATDTPPATRNALTLPHKRRRPKQKHRPPLQAPARKRARRVDARPPARKRPRLFARKTNTQATHTTRRRRKQATVRNCRPQHRTQQQHPTARLFVVAPVCSDHAARLTTTPPAPPPRLPRVLFLFLLPHGNRSIVLPALRAKSHSLLPFVSRRAARASAARSVAQRFRRPCVGRLPPLRNLTCGSGYAVAAVALSGFVVAKKLKKMRFFGSFVRFGRCFASVFRGSVCFSKKQNGSIAFAFRQCYAQAHCFLCQLGCRCRKKNA